MDLNAARISALVDPLWDITVQSCVSSTNDLLKEWALQGAGAGTVLIAQSQSAGKGRLGRSFYSPDGGVYLSLLLRPNVPAEETLFYTVAAAVAAADACEAVSDCQAKIKWVNDIYVNGKKVCGILSESVWSGKENAVIVGIGANLTTPKGGFPPDIAQKAGALPNVCKTAGTDFCITFLNRFAAFNKDFLTHSFLPEYRRRSCLIGRAVTLKKGTQIFRGVAEDIDENAALVLRLENGQARAFSAGEVTTQI